MEKIYTLKKDAERHGNGVSGSAENPEGFSCERDFKIKYGEELNEQQLDVVKNGDGAALVLAGPGSGKTRVLVYRVAYLLESGVNPENILLLTFTNKAAKNMLSRIEELLGYYPKGLMGGTFHHIGNMILRKHSELIGFDSNFSIIDNEDSIQLVKDIIATVLPKRDKHFPSPNVIFSIIGFSKNSASPITDCIKNKYENFSKFANEIKRIGEIYGERKKRAGMMDFDDLLFNWEKLLDNEQMREKYASQFKYILVDEFQDTNKLQFAIIRKLSGKGNNIMVVGDDCQSIYSFRAAEVRNILDFPEHYKKQGNFREFRLEMNYRSTPEIMSLVNESIRHNKSQFEKTLKAANKSGSLPIIVRCKDSKQEAEFVGQRILELRDEGIPYGEIGVLFRADYQSVQMELELAKKGIPFIKRGGLKFFEQAHVKDITSVLKIFNNAKDELAWKRVLCLFDGVGQVTAGKIWEQLSKSDNPLESLKSNSFHNAHNAKTPKGLAQLRGIAKRITIKFPSEIINIFFEEFYRDYLQEKYPNARDRILDVKQFINLADQYQNINGFLDDIILDADIGRGGEESYEEKLMLSTIHQAKGLEWKAVFVISLAEDRFPLSRVYADGTLEEERRLFYVACSRCKKELYLTMPMEDFTFWGGNQILKDSIFVQELPENCREEWGIREETQDEEE